ncbi:MAG: SBBP repeat-containing protein, partial [candidate division WOR-3 bacterium]|nr:SBBP repeat-containing protein [candidate division WOR-3 bacterium]
MNKRRVVFLIIICILTPILLNAQYIRWIRRYNGPPNSYNNDDKPTAIAVDNQGNVYVTGSSVGRFQPPYFYYYDWATIKYYPNGDTAWIRRYNGPDNNHDYAYALANDGTGNVYVTGSSYSDSTNLDWLTIKYNANGDIVWSKSFNGTGNLYDEAYAIALDNSGNVYVTGYSYNSSSSEDYTTIKYNSNGDTAWVRYFNGPFNSEDEACAIAVDNQGNVY